MNKIALTTTDLVERRLKKTMTGGVVKLTPISVYIGVFWLILASVEGWKYHLGNNTMTWNKSREWCQKHFTDIAEVYHENVTDYLTKLVPSKDSSPYYWIGLRKNNDTWTWVASGKIVTYQNWGNGEPNNLKTGEDCVEYISNPKNNGKWNDENCKTAKYPLCHEAHCLNESCSDRELCIERVNNFTCVCKPGFSGPHCEKVVSCERLSTPPHGWMNCAGQYGDHSLNSKCKFSCAGGYKLRGTAELKCNSSGAWNVPPPSCAAVECFPLLLFGGGLVNCTEGHDSSRSACRVQCPPGHLLLGFAEFTCGADGMWESSFPLMCASFVHFLIALLASVVISVFCGCFCCSNCRKSKQAGRVRTQQETLNPAFEAEHTPQDGPLCSA